MEKQNLTTEELARSFLENLSYVMKHYRVQARIRFEFSENSDYKFEPVEIHVIQTSVYMKDRVYIGEFNDPRTLELILANMKYSDFAYLGMEETYEKIVETGYGDFYGGDDKFTFKYHRY